jgi:hypothetical protein
MYPGFDAMDGHFLFRAIHQQDRRLGTQEISCG